MCAARDSRVCSRFPPMHEPRRRNCAPALIELSQVVRTSTWARRHSPPAHLRTCPCAPSHRQHLRICAPAHVRTWQASAYSTAHFAPTEHGAPLKTDRKISGLLPRRVNECAVPRGTTAKTPAWRATSLPPTLCVPSPPSTYTNSSASSCTCCGSG